MTTRNRESVYLLLDMVRDGTRTHGRGAALWMAAAVNARGIRIEQCEVNQTSFAFERVLKIVQMGQLEKSTGVPVSWGKKKTAAAKDEIRVNSVETFSLIRLL